MILLFISTDLVNCWLFNTVKFVTATQSMSCCFTLFVRLQSAKVYIRAGVSFIIHSGDLVNCWPFSVGVNAIQSCMLFYVR